MTERKPILIAVILNWNGAAATIRCAESFLLAVNYCLELTGTASLIIVDNGSETSDLDLTRSWIEAQSACPISLLCNDSNLGFAAGMNRGIEHALQSRPDYVWLLNNDLEVGPESVGQLLNFSRDTPHAVIVGSTMLHPSTGRVQAAGGYIYHRWLGYNTPLLAGTWPHQLPTNLSLTPDYIDGAAMWLSGEFLQRVGGLPDDQFLYFEELQLKHTLDAGETIAWCRTSLVYHEGGGSMKTAKIQEKNTFHAALSAFCYTRRYYPWCLPTVIVARILGITARAARRGQPGLITAVFRAVRVMITPSKGVGAPIP